MRTKWIYLEKKIATNFKKYKKKTYIKTQLIQIEI